MDIDIKTCLFDDSHNLIKGEFTKHPVLNKYYEKHVQKGKITKEHQKTMREEYLRENSPRVRHLHLYVQREKVRFQINGTKEII